MKALNISSEDIFAFERGLKAQGYTTDSERRYQVLGEVSLLKLVFGQSLAEGSQLIYCCSV